ncbi:MAG: amidohydrolase family protein [Saprospiraceae bacterium]
MIKKFLIVGLFIWTNSLLAQSYFLLMPDRVFDGDSMYSGWQVLVRGNVIESVGLNLQVPKNCQSVKLQGTTLMPGMIEGHSHILLHPYNETSWSDQVMFESEAERILRASNHLKASLLAGITSMRDLGTEGTGFSDVAIRRSIEKKLIIGPDLKVAGRAIVATGSYAPKSPVFDPPYGAERADGNNVIKVVRDQIGHGVDVIKIYADFKWGPTDAAVPTFSIEEIKLMVETAESAGSMVVAHATSKEGMRRAVMGGARTIEHGDEGDTEVFELMKKHHVALCPTLAAGEAYLMYAGWKKGTDSIPEGIKNKIKSFGMALKSGVDIIFGGDVGVFSHGDNVRELILMQQYGMKNLDVIKCATSGNADILNFKQKGRIRKGYLADIIACSGNPLESLKSLYDIQFVMKSGNIIKP